MARKRLYSVVKRVFDVVAALLGLVILSPVFLICVVLVKCTSKGPIFYISDRIGKSSTHFNMIKFRTMRIDTPELATHLLKDPKAYLTPVGSFFRKTSLDEIPQLINVLKGEMSLVGPRPALYNQEDQIALRKKTKTDQLVPGITGWAQINGRDEISIKEKVELDTWYLEHRSLFLDIKILWKTWLNVIRKKGISH